MNIKRVIEFDYIMKENFDIYLIRYQYNINKTPTFSKHPS